MSLDSAMFARLTGLVRKLYPDWDGFDHKGFVEDEVKYKQESAQKAQELLSQSALHDLLRREDFEEFIQRLEKIGKDNNLLWKSVPKQGDLSILYIENLDRPRFCRAVSELLHGTDSIDVRFGAYLDALEVMGIKDTGHNKWTFPTYFLFLTHPESDFFVKPSVVKKFLVLIGRGEIFTTKPTVQSYVQIRGEMRKLREMLHEYSPHDLSLIHI